MRVGIKMSDCMFYVNEEKRTVVCVIPDTSMLLTDFIYDNFDKNDISFQEGIRWHLDRKLQMPNSFTGKAVCAKEDEWNEELGRMIAFSRAKDKCYKSFFKRANLFIQTIDKRLNDAISDFNDFGMKLENRRENLNKSIDELITKGGEA